MSIKKIIAPSKVNLKPLRKRVITEMIEKVAEKDFRKKPAIT